MLLYRFDNQIIKKENNFLDNDESETIYHEYDQVDNKDKEYLENFFKLNHAYITQESTISHKLREEDEILYLSITLFENNQQTDLLSPNVIKFIITEECLISIKNSNVDLIEDYNFNHVKNKNIKKYNLFVFFIIIKNIIDNLAKSLEDINHQLEYQNTLILGVRNVSKVSYKSVLKNVTVVGNSISKIRESIISLTRMIVFLTQSDSDFLNDNFKNHLHITLEDLNALSEHTNSLSAKIDFLLNATLGLINTEQNNIIKIFSVTSLIFTPPTLIASIYGMNFKTIPELNWNYGYIYVLCLMYLSAWLPYKIFKKKKWL